ncbi:MAG TPA: SUMF1/EgtB/PvdO family nonheme iron enzyme [Stellaceae bacterium]|nr:SUMF1/EgtB/PvdO family nonheme iron enzyme [Stellaceae bacterium]
MEETDIKRKLATIMVADIVGFSRLAATDEDWTIRSLGDFRKIVDEIIERHDGRIFNTGGDSVLAEFASPVEAVRAAVDFQEASRSRNLLQPRDRQLRFRIGINLGDVMVRGTDLLGDGVNVAARLEGLAEPGGICVSGTVWDHINGKLSIGYVDIGEQSVKNIPRPVRAYHLRVDGTVGEVAEPAGKAPVAASAGAVGGKRAPVAAIIAGLAVLLLVVAGIAAWQLWPKPAGPTSQKLPGETIVAQPSSTASPSVSAPPTPSSPPIVIPPATPSTPITTAQEPPSTPTAPSSPPPVSAQSSSPQAPSDAAPAPSPTAPPQAAPTVQPSAAAQGAPKTFRDCPNCPEMVVVPAGSFQMGTAPGENQRFGVPSVEAARGEPQHEVTFAKPFALGKFDVTRAEFAAFVQAAAFRPRPGCQTLAGNVWVPQPQATWEEPGFNQTDNDPVVCMNEIEIGAYLTWLKRKTGKDYRLPSEAEWEYAERAGATTAFYWGDNVKDACAHENVGDEAWGAKYGVKQTIPCNDGFADLAPVGSFKPNAFGLYDMAGNIFVLTADCWNEGYAGAPNDGSAWMTGDCTRHVARKSAFGNPHPWMFRAANREAEGLLARRNRFGFRVALSLP